VGWVGESLVVCDAHLHILQIHTSSFEVSQWREMAPLFSVWCGIGRLSMGLGSVMSQNLFLLDALSSACRERERKKK
jgi:hypothetical protein